MNRFLLSGLLAFALVLSACDKQSSVNEPIAPSTNDVSTVLKLTEQLDLNIDQMAQINEMFYLEEDLRLILTPSQMTTFNNLINGITPSVQDDRKGIDRRRIVDMEAIMYFRLILAANPDLSEEVKQQIRDLIAASNKARAEAIRANAGNPEAIKAALTALHQKLMEDITGLLTQEQILAVEELKAKIEARRKEMHDRWVAARLDAQVAFLTTFLTLDDADKAALRTILMEQQAAIEALRLQYAGDPEGFRAALKALMASTDAAIVALLDDAQKLLWEKLKSGKLGRGGITPGGGHTGKRG